MLLVCETHVKGIDRSINAPARRAEVRSPGRKSSVASRKLRVRQDDTTPYSRECQTLYN